MWQALADPEAQPLWARATAELFNEVGRWPTTVHLLAYSLAWPRIDVGLRRWIDLGRSAMDDSLSLLNDMVGGRIVERAK
jgi:uncharacterized membrane protein YhaH (DUF805 family)